MSQQEQTVFRKIYLTVNAETASLADPATQENLTSSEIPSVFLGETVIFCISLVKNSGEAFPLDGGDTFELCIDNAFRNTNQPMAFSGNGCFNVAGDWSSASLANGKISVRVSCNTTQFAQAVGTQQTLTAWMEIKKYSAGGSSNSVLLLDRVLAKNVVFTNGLEPDALGENYYTKAQVDSIMASGLAIELSSANVITSAAVVSQASSVAALQALTVSSGGSVSVSSAGSVSMTNGSASLSSCSSFVVSGGSVSTGTVGNITVSGGEITSASSVTIGGGASQSSLSYENLSGKPSINSVVLSGNKTADDLGLFSTDGWEIEALAGTTVTSAGKIYTHTVAADESFTFPTPVSGVDNAFELHLTQPATAVSFTLPAVTWKFATPDLSTAGKTYQLRFRYLNGAWEGWAVPEMSQYMLKSGGTFTGDVAISYNKSLTMGYSSWGNASKVLMHCNKTGFGHWNNYGTCTNSIIVGNSLVAEYNYLKLGSGWTAGVYPLVTQIYYAGKLAMFVGTEGSTQAECVPNVTITKYLTVNDYIKCKGQHLVSQTDVAITPEHDAVFVHTLADNETLSIVTTSLTSTYNVVFRLRLVQGATAATGFTLPSNVTWIGTTPTCTAANTTYQLKIEWDGTRLIGQQEYEVANAE